MPQARDAAAGVAHAADECSSSSAGWMTVQVKRSSRRGAQGSGSQQPGSAKSDSAAAASCRSPLQPSSPAARYQLLSFQHAAAQPFTSSHTASTKGRGAGESAVDTRRCSYARAAEAAPSAAPLASPGGVAGQLSRRPGGCTTNAWAVPALPALLRQHAADAQAGSAASGATSAPAPGSPAARSELAVPTEDLSSPPAAVPSPSRYLPPHQRRQQQQQQQQEPQPASAASCLGSRTRSDDHAGWPVGLRGSSISCPGSCVAAEQEGDEGAAGGHMEPAAAAAAAAAAELRAAEQRPLAMLRMPAPSHVPCKQSPDLHLDHGSCWPPLCSTRASAKAASQAQRKQQEEDDDAAAARQVVDPAEQPQAGTPCSRAAGQATATSGTAVAQPEATPAAQPHEQQRACVVGDVAQREAAAALVGGHGVPGELPVAGSSGSAALLVPPGTPVPQSPVMLPPSPPLLHPMWAPLMSHMATSTPFGFGFGFAAAAAQLPSHMLEDGQAWGFPAPMHVRVTDEGAQAICALDMALPPPASASTTAAAAGLPAAFGSPACSAVPALASPHMPAGTAHHPAMGPLPYHATLGGPAESQASAPHMNPFSLVSKGRVVPHLDAHRPLQPGPAEDLHCYWLGEQPLAPMMVPYPHHRSQQGYARDMERQYAPPRHQAPCHAAAYSSSRPPAYTPRQAPRQFARGPYAISAAPAPARSAGPAPCSNSSSSSSSTAPSGVAATPMGAPGPAAEQGTAVSAVKQASLTPAPSFTPAALPACGSVAASCCSEGDSPRTSSGLTSLVARSSSFGGCGCDELDVAAAGHESGPGPAGPPPPPASSTTAATTESSSGYAASTASSAVVSVASPPPSSCPSVPATRTNSSSSSSNGSAFAPQQWRGHAYPPTLSGPGGRGPRGRGAPGDPPPPGGRLPVVLPPSPGGQQWQHQDRPGYGPGRRPTNPRWRGYPQQHAPPRQQQVPGPLLYPAAQHGMWPAAGAPLMYMLPVPGTAPPGSPPGWVTPVAVPAPPAHLTGTRV